MVYLLAWVPWLVLLVFARFVRFATSLRRRRQGGFKKKEKRGRKRAPNGTPGGPFLHGELGGGNPRTSTRGSVRRALTLRPLIRCPTVTGDVCGDQSKKTRPPQNSTQRSTRPHRAILRWDGVWLECAHAFAPRTAPSAMYLCVTPRRRSMPQADHCQMPPSTSLATLIPNDSRSQTMPAT